MIRIHIFAAAAALSLGATAAPALAQSREYRAVPATAVPAGIMIADGAMWHCGQNGCVTTNAASRPAVACAQAVRKVGLLASFTVGTQPFDAAALAKCNARAKA